MFPVCLSRRANEPEATMHLNFTKSQRLGNLLELHEDAVSFNLTLDAAAP